MKIVRIYTFFTPQARTVSALRSMYAQLQQGNHPQPELTPIVVFLAFAIESYLNSIGARQLDIWDELERLPWRKKMSILHRIADKSPDWGTEPLQFATEIFSLRDKLAHGKAESVDSPLPVNTNIDRETFVALHGSSDLVQPDWYANITIAWVIEARGRFESLMAYLGKLFGYSASDYLESAQSHLEFDVGPEKGV
jgi:hypothetical protein